ncbi:MAG TPA: tetratricopeptide repeat protein [Pseudosphingobacterium sp.]|nr:tetratricopeptide repeat protein [Pseudosphingobacterium sp.]
MSTERLEKLFNFLQTNPNDPFILYAIATEYAKKNEVKDALKFYQQLVDHHPNYVGTYYHFGKLYEALGQKENAISTYEKGMAIAKQINDSHALSELQAVHKAASGDDIEDEEW